MSEQILYEMTEQGQRIPKVYCYRHRSCTSVCDSIVQSKYPDGWSPDLSKALAAHGWRDVEGHLFCSGHCAHMHAYEERTKPGAVKPVLRMPGAPTVKAARAK